MALPECDEIMVTVLFAESETSFTVNAFLRSLKIPQSVAFNEKYISNCALETLFKAVDESGACCFCSRMDQTTAKRVVLERLVNEYGVRAFDLAHEESTSIFSDLWPREEFSLFHFSNARALAQVGSRFSTLHIPEANFANIAPLMAHVGWGEAMDRNLVPAKHIDEIVADIVAE